MRPTVYAFAGRRHSGKSTASAVLVEKGFVDLKFADPLKNMMRALYHTCGVSKEDIERKLEGDLKEVPCEWLGGRTPRHAMQTLGTEWRDLVSTSMWSDIFVKRVLGGKYGDKIVCSDFRFPHEAAALDSLEAHTYRIERDSLVQDEYSDHASEVAIDQLPVKGVVHNDGTIEELREVVLDLIAVNEVIDDEIDDIREAIIKAGLPG